MTDSEVQNTEKADQEGQEESLPDVEKDNPIKQNQDIEVSSGNVPFDEDIEIRPGKRLEQYDSGPVKAYAAIGSGKRKGELVALVCEKNLVPRVNSAPYYAGLINPSLVHLVACGVIYWPPSAEQRYVFIYQRMMGNPLLKVGGKPALDWKHDEVMHRAIPSLVSVLMDFRDKDFVHGDIRPSNMFEGGTAGGERIVLGECLSLPPSYAQPVLYEPVERAMATPVSRGLSTRADDMYAFGVSLTVMLRHHDPMAGLSDEQIIAQKMEIGSYAAITGKDRFTGAILELLRGLLYDDPAQRWTIDEVQSWLDGQRLSPKQAAKKVKAARPIHFNGERYFRPHVLAMDLHKNPGDAIQLVEGGNLMQWMERSIEDPVAIGRVEKALELSSADSGGVDYNDRMLCRLSIALDPDAPLRYKGLSVRPEGMGYALADAIYRKKDINIYAEIMLQHFAAFWADSRVNEKVDFSALINRLDTCRAYLRQKNVGYGVERCLYTLSPECPCLSEKLDKYYVRSPEDLMYAYEDMIARGNPPARFFDRHIVAFLSVKDRKTVDGYLVELNSEGPYEQVMGTLKTLATVQKRSKMGPFPNIARYLTTMFEPIYQRYHDRVLRKNFQIKIDAIKETGDLTKLAVLFDNREITGQDFSGYKKALREYFELKKEKGKLEMRMQREGEFGQGTGRQIAAIFSGVLAGAIILLFGLLHFSQFTG